ncbi:Hydroxylysine kinase [Labeo rohita]|uniref:Hydroxylysine kinase n=1 Tax=Labeo rohita TaxID=84645 RepID=A0ABQ8LHJ4_LABRO|nr:Hydroxylysine kinase [Labeo rohita]
MSTKDSKPNLSHSQAIEIVKRLYGLTVSVIRPLPSYDDQNLYVATSEGAEYVLKVMNSADSQNITVIELQTHTMNFLHQRGLPAQTALPNLTGQLMSLEEFDCGFGTQKYLVRLLTYLPGTTVAKITCSPQILYDVGKMAATLDTVLLQMDHPNIGVLQRKDFIWNLSSVPLLSQYIHVMDGDPVQKVVKAVMEQYQTQVVPKLPLFRKWAPFALITASIRCGMEVISLWQLLRWCGSPGFFDSGLHSLWGSGLVSLLASQAHHEDFGSLGNSPFLLLLSPGKTPLTSSVVQEWLNKRNTTTVAKFLDTSVCGGVNHGDFNDHNLLVKPDGPSKYEISGILDFGDMSCGYFIFELAISIMYMMIENPNPVDVGGPVIAGWESVFPLNEAERDSLYLLVLCRFCQSLVLARHAVIQQPENEEYLMITARTGVRHLCRLWELGKEEVERIWFKSAAQFSQP